MMLDFPHLAGSGRMPALAVPHCGERRGPSGTRAYRYAGERALVDAGEFGIVRHPQWQRDSDSGDDAQSVKAAGVFDVPKRCHAGKPTTELQG